MSVEQFEKTFGKTYIAKARGSKIILKGLNLLDAFVDVNGIYLPGKTTLVINSANIDNLFFIAGILNSAYAIFYIKTKYSSSSYCGGITFTKDMIDSLPVPHFSNVDRARLIHLSKAATNIRTDNPSGNIDSILKEIDSLIFKSWGFNYDEVLIIDPANTITEEEYNKFK
ncbi:MAG: hypothetical protein K2G85_09605 [Muribaculaceae bacterium]|nr:hypothetical protein [Muribaculaceae bacterium]